MTMIVDVHGRQVLDSRGEPDGGGRGAPASPARKGQRSSLGASTGTREAVSCGDRDPS